MDHFSGIGRPSGGLPRGKQIYVESVHRGSFTMGTKEMAPRNLRGNGSLSSAQVGQQNGRDHFSVHIYKSASSTQT